MFRENSAKSRTRWLRAVALGLALLLGPAFGGYAVLAAGSSGGIACTLVVMMVRANAAAEATADQAPPVAAPEREAPPAWPLPGDAPASVELPGPAGNSQVAVRPLG
ncbi:MAG: hypothetical protein GC191_10435 [Azospirillum sp.]|nr:hypothetical protein [Azospirillum sp.]